jgi:enediyne biosynthesis protein E4
VVDAASGGGLAGANVVFSEELGTFCDTRGCFRLSALPGSYTLEVTMVGYESLRRELHVPEEGLKGIVFRLRALTIPMDEIVVESPRPRLPQFTDVTVAAGIDFEHFYGEGPLESILESSGAGVCFCDFIGDGRADIYLVNGARLGGETESQPTNALYRNEGNSRFTDVTDAAGVGDVGYGMGCAGADYDNDGDLDIYVTNYGPNALYRNEGDGRFIEIGDQAGVANPLWSVCASWADYDNDGHLDLFVGNYLDLESDYAPARSLVSLHEGYRYYPGPRDYESQPDVLYRNRGDGTFEDISEVAGLNPRLGKAMGCSSSDFDGDGDMDLFIGNDRTPNQLYRNEGNGHFTEVALWAGVAYDEAGHESGAMAPDFGDYDNDGRLDLFVTNFSFEYNTLYRNRGEERFDDVTIEAGLATPSYRYVGWGTGFLDYDNDGWLDIFVANGDVHEDMDIFSESVTFEQPDQLFHNDGDGTFSEVSAASGPHFLESHVGRGAAFADYDEDGDLDILVLNAGEGVSLLRNDGGNREHWLGLKLVGRSGNRDGIGARVEVEAGSLRMVREVRSGASYLSQHDMRIFFGLGGRGRAEKVMIRWPTGRRDSLENVAADRLLIVTEGGGYTPNDDRP